MIRASRVLLAAVVLASFQAGCGGSSSKPAAGATLTGTLFGQPFTAASALLVHPQQWKSAAAGSTALLVSDTPDLCAQITSGKTTAPGRLLIVRLEQRDAAGAIIALTPGTFTQQGEGTASSRFGDVYASAVDAGCVFAKLFADQVQVDVTSAGTGGAPLAGSLTAHTTGGESVAGTFSVSASCDETAVDAYLNRSPTCT